MARSEDAVNLGDQEETTMTLEYTSTPHQDRGVPLGQFRGHNVGEIVVEEDGETGMD